MAKWIWSLVGCQRSLLVRCGGSLAREITRCHTLVQVRHWWSARTGAEGRCYVQGHSHKLRTKMHILHCGPFTWDATALFGTLLICAVSSWMTCEHVSPCYACIKRCVEVVVQENIPITYENVCHIWSGIGHEIVSKLLKGVASFPLIDLMMQMMQPL